MSDNERLFLAYEYLKKKGSIKTYVQLAEILGTNKAGINDLKNGKKKVSLENIKSMIFSYPEISLRWLVLEEGDPIENKIEVNSSLKPSNELNFNVSNELLILQKEKIEQLQKEILELKSNTKEPFLSQSMDKPASKLTNK